jgi:class 3 adenylate cyclase
VPALRLPHLIWLVPLAALAALSGHLLGPRLDGVLYDAQTRALRALAPSPAPDVAIVGIDQASIDAIPAPMALWHAQLGAALGAIAAAGPRLTGLDVVLPDRSFDALLPGLDRALLRGIVQARDAGGIVLALQPDADGRLRRIHPPFLAAAGSGGHGAALFPVDADGVVRRVDPQLSTFSAALATRFGRALKSGGLIDYTRGEAFSYVPLIDVLRAAERGDTDRLARWFRGRVVLVGSVLPLTDRRAQPAPLAGWEPPHREPPGVLIHAQVVRSVLGDGLIKPAPAWAVASVLLVMLAPTLLVSQRWRYLALGLLGTAALVGSTMALRAGLHLPVAAACGTGLLTALARSALDARQARRERDRLRQTFAGFVSPPVFDDLVSGALAGRGRATIAALFADVRGFTTMSEAEDAGAVLDLLNRYYAAITPALHARGGAIDSFRGDGLMAVFGAPRPLPEAPASALAAARDLLAALQLLNAELEREGRAPLAVGIGLAWGEAVFGDLGSRQRRSFTVIGDAVNVAARLQDLTKALGAPILLTDALRAALPPDEAAALHDFGVQAIKGHTPVRVWGWSPEELPVVTT